MKSTVKPAGACRVQELSLTGSGIPELLSVEYNDHHEVITTPFSSFSAGAVLYYENGIIQRAETVNEGDTIEGYEIYNYTADLLTKVSRYSRMGEIYVQTSVDEFEYENNRVKKRTAYGVNTAGEKEDAYSYSNYQYDSAGNMIMREVFNRHHPDSSWFLYSTFSCTYTQTKADPVFNWILDPDIVTLDNKHLPSKQIQMKKSKTTGELETLWSKTFVYVNDKNDYVSSVTVNGNKTYNATYICD